jgi:hypothetical protein
MCVCFQSNLEVKKMADATTMPNIFTMPQGNDSFNMGAITPLILGAALFGGRGLFGNNGNAEGVTVAAVNDAAQAAAQQVLAAQNQAQTMQDVNRIPISVKESQADIQHDVSAGFASTNNNILQGQIASMQGQANIINSIDSHTNDITNSLERQTQGIAAQFANTNAAIAATGAAAALAAKDAQISGLQNTAAILQAINADGDKTREVINANYISDLQGRLTDAKNQVTELSMEGRSAQRARDLEVNVTQNVNQNQMQMQQQQQSIYTNSLLVQLLAAQNATAGNMNILGTQGAINQTPVNVGRV